MMTEHLERRLTRFPGSREAGQISRQSPGEADQPHPKPTAKLKRRLQAADTPLTPPRLPIKINPSSNSWLSVAKRPSAPFCETGSPWDKFHRLLPEDQAGPVIVAHEHHLTFPVVAIKQRDLTENLDTKRLLRICHGNIVGLLAAFHDKSQVYFIYESMLVSLTDVQGCYYGPLKEFELAAICKEILQGLIYIKQELQVCHPPLDTDQILLGGKGDVKIANIGDCLLSGAKATGGSQELGLLLFGLMEPGTRMADKITITLTSTASWGEQIRDFLRLTAVENLETLQKHVFLEFSPGPTCLVPYVEVARRGRPEDSTALRDSKNH